MYLDTQMIPKCQVILAFQLVLCVLEHQANPALLELQNVLQKEGSNI